MLTPNPLCEAKTNKIWEMFHLNFSCSFLVHPSSSSFPLPFPTPHQLFHGAPPHCCFIPGSIGWSGWDCSIIPGYGHRGMAGCCCRSTSWTRCAWKESFVTGTRKWCYSCIVRIMCTIQNYTCHLFVKLPFPHFVPLWAGSVKLTPRHVECVKSITVLLQLLNQSWKHGVVLRL